MVVKPPAYLHYAKDFLTGTMTLPLAARGLYASLLSYQWDAGGIPDDPILMARAASCEVEEIAKFWPVLRSKFRLERDGIWRNLKLKRQKRDLLRRHKVNVHNGKQGGRPKTHGFRLGYPKRNPNPNPNERLPISNLQDQERTPPYPPRAEGERTRRVSMRQPSKAERERAERALKSMNCCPHDPGCDSFAQCVGRMVQDEREKIAAGQRAAPRREH